MRPTGFAKWIGRALAALALFGVAPASAQVYFVFESGDDLGQLSLYSFPDLNSVFTDQGAALQPIPFGTGIGYDVAGFDIDGSGAARFVFESGDPLGQLSLYSFPDLASVFTEQGATLQPLPFGTGIGFDVAGFDIDNSGAVHFLFESGDDLGQLSLYSFPDLASVFTEQGATLQPLPFGTGIGFDVAGFDIDDSGAVRFVFESGDALGQLTLYSFPDLASVFTDQGATLQPLPFGTGIGFNVAGFAIASNGVSQVPEPRTWMILLLGFAAVGGAMRRQRKVVGLA